MNLRRVNRLLAILAACFVLCAMWVSAPASATGEHSPKPSSTAVHHDDDDDGDSRAKSKAKKSSDDDDDGDSRSKKKSSDDDDDDGDSRSKKKSSDDDDDDGDSGSKKSDDDDDDGDSGSKDDDDDDDGTVPDPKPRPRGSLSVDKIGPAMAHDGDLVTYSFVVTNTGPGGVRNVVVQDNVIGTIGTIDALADGASSKLSTTFIVPAGSGPLTNVAKACGVDSAGLLACGSDTHTLRRIHPAIRIDKNADPVQISGQGEVTYTYTVANAGDVALAPVSVTDDVLGPIGTIGSLAPGESARLTRKILATPATPPRNVGTATGRDPLGMVVTASDDATISVVLGSKVTVSDPLPAPDPASVPPLAQVASARAGLPFTGGPLLPMAAAGAWLVAAGATAVRRARRR